MSIGYDITHLAFEVEYLNKFATFAASKGYPLSDNGPTASAEGDIFGFVDAPGGYETELIEKARMVV